ncbi:pancreatic triacylglycerol lipase-like [Ptychodera flava]|uniref:pancreatic triacylglycerol lipase-like n=1 Tax=Ptychodera flava TaxID=63121 RepID=UPI00396A1F56
MRVAVCFVFLAVLTPGWCWPEFRLYTRSNRNSYQVLTADAGSVGNSNFATNRDTKYIIHGWTESGASYWMLNMKDEFLDYANYNVIIVDWEDGAKGPTYGQSVENTKTVGKETSDFIKFLNDHRDFRYSFSRNHLIGFSLGAQCSGYAGRDTQNLPNPRGQVGRITGLDPAGPGFEGNDPADRIDETDADFVDIIHTDADPLYELGFGIWQECGDVDFYPNGGKNQPGCGLLPFENGVEGGEICDHGRAHYYFIESIRSSCKFEAYPCDKESQCYSCGLRGCNRMGFHAGKSPNGVFYLETNSQSPYCQK